MADISKSDRSEGKKTVLFRRQSSECPSRSPPHVSMRRTSVSEGRKSSFKLGSSSLTDNRVTNAVQRGVHLVVNATRFGFNKWARDSAEHLDQKSLLSRFDSDGDKMVDYEEFAKYVHMAVHEELEPNGPIEKRFINMLQKSITP